MRILDLHHLDGSLQNPAFSPDGKALVVTRFCNGYNRHPADLFIVDLATLAAPPLIENAAENVSEPGSTWNHSTDEIVFSSDLHGSDQAYVIKPDGSGLKQITQRSGMVWEPSLSPDAQSLVYEYHVNEARGQIVIHDRVTNARLAITRPDQDCRQPCWSPKGDLIVYQRRIGEMWCLWLYDVAHKTTRQFTLGGNETDATFSPDGEAVLYSNGALILAPVKGGRGQKFTGAAYMGAPSIAPDFKTIACECSEDDADPDESGSPTKIALIDL